MDFGDLIFFVIFVIVIISNIVKQMKKAGKQPSGDAASEKKAQKKSGWKNVLEEMLEEARKQMEEKDQPESAGEPLKPPTGWEEIAPEKKPSRQAPETRPEIRQPKRPRQKPVIREDAVRQRTAFKPDCMRCNASMKEIPDLGIENQSGLIYCDSCGEQHKYRVVNGELKLKRTDAIRKKNVIAPERRYGKADTRPAPPHRMPDAIPVTALQDNFEGAAETAIHRRLSREGLQNAVVWSEILGKPLGLRDIEV